MSVISKGSGSDEEPLVPDDFDDEFFDNLKGKVPEITKALRQKDTQDNADNVQRLVIIGNRYKADLLLAQLRAEEQNHEIAKLQERLEDLNKLSKLDQGTIGELKGVIENAWKQKDAAQMREQVAHDELIKLREKVEDLEHKLEQLSDKRSLQNKRDDDKERAKLKTELQDLNKRLQSQRSYTSEVEAMTHTLEEKNKVLLKLLEDSSTEAYNSKKQIDALQKELEQLQQDLLKKTEQIAQTKTQNEQLTKVKVRQNLQILSLKTNLEHLHTQYNATCNKLAKVTVELEYAVQERDKNKRELVQRCNLLKVREDEIIKLKQDNAKVTKNQESTARKYANLDDAKRQAEAEQTRLRTQLSTQEKELESLRRLVHQFENNNGQLVKERDILKRDLLVEFNNLAETDKQAQESHHKIRALQDTIHTMEIGNRKLQEQVLRTQKETAKKADEMQGLLDKIDSLQNKLYLKDNLIFELKRTVADMEQKCARLKSEQNALQGERSGLQRGLRSADEEKEKLQKQVSQSRNLLDLQKGQVESKDHEISKLQLEIDKLEKDRRMLRTAMKNAQLNHFQIKDELSERKKENDRYSKGFQELELRVARMKQELDNSLKEKNQVGALLTKRTDECAVLKNKLNNLEAVHSNSEKQLAQYMDDLRLLRVEIKNLRTERDVLRKDRECSADLRQELLQMHRVLNQERVKGRALQEEMMTPMNVHRWRNLQGKDPDKMDLIQKIQVLRKQLLSQNVTNLEQERILNETQQLYTALKEFLQKLPSYKTREKLHEMKAVLSSKDKKLKALKAELNVKDAEERKNNAKMEDMKTSLATTKSVLLQEKKCKQKILEEQQQLVDQMQEHCFSAPPQTQRTLGGGFKMDGGY